MIGIAVRIAITSIAGDMRSQGARLRDREAAGRGPRGCRDAPVTAAAPSPAAVAAVGIVIEVLLLGSRCGEPDGDG
ncbi:hypothetical protein GCM10025864_43850 [Luteimicrobium album]|uniref:Uncharacterized protein n=1 Tax=Luteimicrobium album TaxID=1054550 RepID=A0ABQ6I8J4_9MICO|nr:hypothetical protein GCM10025864_43850 [Luteimicrobium album]